VAGFDFFRVRRSGYAPRTPAGALKAIGTGTLPVEQFVYASASAKPLDEELLDLDTIEQVLARTGLTLATNMLLKGVFEKLITSDDTEIALFGAEGINALEARYVKRNEERKRKSGGAAAPAAVSIGESKSADSATIRALARQYYELAELHAREGSIRAFYLRAAYSTLRNARGKGRISRTDLALMVDILVALGLHAQAALLLDRVKAHDNPRVLLLAARVAFHRGAYLRVVECCRRLALMAETLSKKDGRIVAFWTASND
jgi:hypothetical protein